MQDILKLYSKVQTQYERIKVSNRRIKELQEYVRILQEECTHDICFCKDNTHDSATCVICGKVFENADTDKILIANSNVPENVFTEAFMETVNILGQEAIYRNMSCILSVMNNINNESNSQINIKTLSQKFINSINATMQKKKILIICSKSFYDKVGVVKDILEEKRYEVILPNCYEDRDCERKAKENGIAAHKEFKRLRYEESKEKVARCDAVLVLNYDKKVKENGKQKVLENYIGGATFLEMYDAYLAGKKIFILNDVSLCFFSDEISGFNPTVINDDLDNITL